MGEQCHHATQGAAELAQRLASGEITSRELTESLIARHESAEVGALRAVSQPLYNSARQAAAAADKQLAECRAAGTPPPPLCGVPVTIKDCFDVAGTAATLGIPNRTNLVAQDDSPLVARLRAAGAVILGKTNVPQAMLLHCCDNPVHGRTLHPHNPQRGPGGSSGGEAAIVAAGGSPLGLGSDLGGSIRQPAHACGLAGLKPTSGRLTNVGSHRGLQGMDAIAIQAGPLAHKVEDIDLAMRVLVGDPHHAEPDQAKPDQAEPDESARPWPDYRTIDVASLKVACWPSDGWFEPAPTVRRAVVESASALSQSGVNVRTLPPEQIEQSDVRRAVELYFGLLSADGLKSIRRMLKGGAVDWQVRRQLWFAGWPRLARGPLSLLLRLFAQRQLAEMLQMSGPRSADRYWQLTTQAKAYADEFWQRLDQQHGSRVDALLLPAHPLPALKHGTALDLLPAASYCYLPNLLGAPAGVVPWTTVRNGEQTYPSTARFDLVQHLARHALHHSEGLPVGVQVVARPWREDIALALMHQLETSKTSDGH